MPSLLNFGRRTGHYELSSRDLYVVSVKLIHDQVNSAAVQCSLSSDSTGQDCIDFICQKLEIEQGIYFGLRFPAINPSGWRWIELDKSLRKQVERHGRHGPGNAPIYMALKYYTPSTTTLTDSSTRYYYFLQMKSDILNCELMVPTEKAIRLASYSIQVACGDHNESIHTADYWLSNRFILFPKNLMTNKNESMLEDLMCQALSGHRTLRGLSSGQAEEMYIQEVQMCDGYGEQYFPVKVTLDGDDGEKVHLGYCIDGIIIRKQVDVPLVYGWEMIKKIQSHKRQIRIELVPLNTNNPLVKCSLEDADTGRYIAYILNEQRHFFTRFMTVGGHTSSSPSAFPSKTNHTLTTNDSTSKYHHQHHRVEPMNSGNLMIPNGSSVIMESPNLIGGQNHPSSPDHPVPKIYSNNGTAEYYAMIDKHAYTSASSTTTTTTGTGSTTGSASMTNRGDSFNSSSAGTTTDQLPISRSLLLANTEAEHKLMMIRNKERMNMNINGGDSSLSPPPQLPNLSNTTATSPIQQYLTWRSAHQQDEDEFCEDFGDEEEDGRQQLSTFAPYEQQQQQQQQPNNYEIPNKHKGGNLAADSHHHQQDHYFNNLHMSDQRMEEEEEDEKVRHQQDGVKAKSTLSAPTSATSKSVSPSSSSSSHIEISNNTPSSNNINENANRRHRQNLIIENVGVINKIDQPDSSLHPPPQQQRNQQQNGHLNQDFIPQHQQYQPSSAATERVKKEMEEYATINNYNSNSNNPQQELEHSSTTTTAAAAGMYSYDEDELNAMAEKLEAMLAGERGSGGETDFMIRTEHGHHEADDSDHFIINQKEDVANEYATLPSPPQQPQQHHHTHQYIHTNPINVRSTGMAMITVNADDNGIDHFTHSPSPPLIGQKQHKYISAADGSAAGSPVVPVLTTTSNNINGTSNPPKMVMNHVTSFEIGGDDQINRLYAYTPDGERLHHPPERLHTTLPPEEEEEEKEDGQAEEDRASNKNSSSYYNRASISTPKTAHKKFRKNGSNGSGNGRAATAQAASEDITLSLSSSLYHPHQHPHNHHRRIPTLEEEHYSQSGELKFTEEEEEGGGRESKALLTAESPVFLVDSQQQYHHPHKKEEEEAVDSVEEEAEKEEEEEVEFSGSTRIRQHYPPNSSSSTTSSSAYSSSSTTSSATADQHHHHRNSNRLESPTASSNCGAEDQEEEVVGTQPPADGRQEKVNAEKDDFVQTVSVNASLTAARSQEMGAATVILNSGIASSRPDLLPAPTASKRSNDERLAEMEKRVRDGMIFEEFDRIPRKRVSAGTSTSQMSENAKFNRIPNIVPYEDTRVMLKPSKNNPCGYINASNIQVPVGDDTLLKYIASQGPTKETVNHFWQMIWESGAHIIVMLTKTEEKSAERCFKYWPSKEDGKAKLKFGDYSIKLMSSTVSKNQITTSLELKDSTTSQKRIIYHLQFLPWPVGGIPFNMDSFLGFLDEVNGVKRQVDNEIQACGSLITNGSHHTNGSGGANGRGRSTSKNGEQRGRSPSTGSGHSFGSWRRRALGSSSANNRMDLSHHGHNSSSSSSHHGAASGGGSPNQNNLSSPSSMNHNNSTATAVAGESPPIVVHCSSGAGRTGVYILVELMIFCLEHNHDLDVPRALTMLRQQRMHLLKTAEQYHFVYDTLIGYLGNSRLI